MDFSFFSLIMLISCYIILLSRSPTLTSTPLDWSIVQLISLLLFTRECFFELSFVNVPLPNIFSGKLNAATFMYVIYESSPTTFGKNLTIIYLDPSFGISKL